MIQNHRTSFLILIALIFLLPLFFIPGGILSMEVAKAALFAFGIILIFLAFVAEYFKEGRFSIPWHPIILVTILLPIVYLISSLLANPSSLSLFGYTLEPGTFGFVLMGSILLILISSTFSDNKRVLQALSAFLASFTLLALFSAVKIFFGGSHLSWGIFTTNVSNPVGAWTDLATSFGLLAIFSALAVEMLPARSEVRISLGIIFFLSTLLLVLINFSTALIFVLVLSILISIYFVTIEKYLGVEVGKTKTFPWPIIVLFALSLIFVINPTISSSGTIGATIASKFNIQNTDVRPSFSTTLTISRAVLAKGALLGSGPNTFDRDWLTHKPVDINTTPFWSTIFPFGIGFIPTQVASTGVIGSLLWIAFLVLLLLLGVKSLRHASESKLDRFLITSTFFGSLYLWLASFLYTPSLTLLALAFIFTGLFIAVLRNIGIISERHFIHAEGRSTNLVSSMFGILLVIGSVVLGFMVFQRTASAYHFGRAVAFSNTSGTPLVNIEGEIAKAINLSPVDTYYSALSRVNFAKANAAAQNTSGKTEENSQIFQQAIADSIAAARTAVSVNPSGYANWVLLGSVYSALVAEPIKIDGAYESAKTAYAEAEKLNPRTPEIPLLLARLEIAHGNMTGARTHIRESIALKEDYAEAYLLLTQLEVSQNNISDAIKSAEVWALLTPENSSIFFELGLLKYSNRDYVGARDAFIRALSLEPNYANAQYYLGLSYAQLGKLDEAKVQFEVLANTNPDSAEVKSILEDLRKGKNPLTATK